MRGDQSSSFPLQRIFSKKVIPKMGDDSAELLVHVREIRKLLELLAEPAIAQRDEKLRTELRRIVGKSEASRKSVLLMNGQHRQKEIQQATGIHAGNLSTLVKKMKIANLLVGDVKFPQLAISIPSNFFDKDAKTD